MSENMKFADALQVQGRVFGANFFREFDLQRGKNGLGFVMAMLEPIFHIGVVCLWHYLVRVQPVYGTSKVLFIASGLYPVFIFIHVSTTFRGTVRAGGSRRRFPIESSLDFIAARVAFKFFVYSLVGVALFWFIFVFVTPQAIPWDFSAVATAVAALLFLGFGMGLCNVCLEAVMPVWPHIYGPLARAFILFSGVLFVPDFMPTHLRQYLVWNPVLHGVDLFRQGFYPGYPTLVYSWSYLWGTGAVLVFFGLCAERAFRRKLEKY